MAAQISEQVFSEHDLHDLEHWITNQGLQETRVGAIVEGLCERLRQAGFPLLRLSVGLHALHPIYSGFGFTWLANSGIVSEDSFLRQSAGGERNPDFLRSPFHYMIQNRLPSYRQNLQGQVEREFDIYRTFRDLGATDYFVRMVSFRGLKNYDSADDIEDENGVIYSWLCDRPGGFSEDDLAVIEHLTPILTLALKAKTGELTALSVAQTYLGKDAGRRVMSGQVDRGYLQTIQAVIFFADLRGFTRLADRLPGEEMVRTLDDYLEVMTGPVVEQGGEVLKFMGDGVLAVFEITDDSCATLCYSAMDATRQVYRRLGELNRSRQAAGQPILELDTALHVGEVLYGNVGAVGRLDFTVVGPAVNEASRLEALCRPLDHYLVISDEFARQAVTWADKLISLGAHELRDLPGSREVFTVRPEIWQSWSGDGDGLSDP